MQRGTGTAESAAEKLIAGNQQLGALCVNRRNFRIVQKQAVENAELR